MSYPPSDEILAFVRALAIRAARIDHEREKLALLTIAEGGPQSRAADPQVPPRSARRQDR